MKAHLQLSVLRWIFVCLAVFPVKALSQLTDWINYTNGDVVTKLLNDGEYLWATTYGGLVKLTKSTGEMQFYTRAQGGLASNNYLQSLAKDKDGIFWIVSNRDGIMKWDGTKSEVFTSSNSGIRTNPIYDVILDEDNNPWFGSIFYLYKKEGDHWKSWQTPGNQGESNNRISRMKFDEEGRLWLAGDASRYWILAQLQEDEIQPIPGISSFGNAGNDLEVDSGAVWMASHNGLFRYKDGEFVVFNTDNSSVPGNVFQGVRKDGAGRLWVACSGYLLKYDGRHFEPFKLPFGSDDLILDLAADPDGTVWMGTRRSGLYRFKDGVFTSLNVSNSPLTTNRIGSSMVMDSQNNIWFGTNNALVKIDADNRWTRYFESEDSFFQENRVQAVAVDPSDQVWVALGRSDTCVVKMAPDGLTAFTAANSPLPVAASHFTGFQFDRRGNTWFGTTQGLFRYDGTNWECFTPENSALKSARINCLAVDRYDQLWGGTDSGLFKYDGTNWEIHTSQNSGMPSDSVASMAFDSDGSVMWLHCGGGLTRFDGADWETYHTGNSGLPSAVIRDIKVDQSHHVWLATEAGVTRFDGQDWTVYTTANSGMSYNQVSNLTLDYYRDRIWLSHLADYGLSSARVDWGVSGLSGKPADAPSVFTLSPNPATTEVRVQCGPDLAGTISVCDISGKILSQTALKGSTTFSLQELGAAQEGVYLVQLVTSQGRHTRKLLVRK